MRFTPKTEKEIAEEGLLPIGTYDFEVAEAENATSKEGNDMIKLKHHVFDAEGNPRIIFDYLLEKMPRKLRNAADATGNIESYKQGALDASDFRGKSGKLKIGIQKDKTGQYPDKNVVADYIKRDGTTGSNATGVHPLDDGIPF